MDEATIEYLRCLAESLYNDALALDVAGENAIDMPEKQNIISLSDLETDEHNARVHTSRNVGMIENALREVGAARSIVIDENDKILAGHATVEAACSVGLEKVVVVDASGDEIIAVRRRGLSAKQKRRLSLFDNRTAELSQWNMAELRSDGSDLIGLWSNEEINDLLEVANTNTDWIFEPPPTVERNVEDIAAIRELRRSARDKVESKSDTERYLVVVFSSREERESLLKSLGLPADERYLSARAVHISIRPDIAARLPLAPKAAPVNKAGATG